MSAAAVVSAYLRGLQQRITQAVNALDGTAFVVDAWEKPAGEPLQGRYCKRLQPQPSQ